MVLRFAVDPKFRKLIIILTKTIITFAKTMFSCSVAFFTVKKHE